MNENAVISLVFLFLSIAWIEVGFASIAEQMIPTLRDKNIKLGVIIAVGMIGSGFLLVVCMIQGALQAGLPPMVLTLLAIAMTMILSNAFAAGLVWKYRRWSRMQTTTVAA